MQLRDREPKEAKAEQKAFEALDSMFESFDKGENVSIFEIPIGALVYILSPMNENHIKYPTLLVEGYGKKQPTNPNLCELIVSHIVVSDSLEQWRNDKNAKPVLCDIPGARMGGRGLVDESLVNVICEDPRNNIEYAYQRVTKLMETRLLMLDGSNDNTATRAAKQLLFDLFYEQHRVIGENTEKKPSWAQVDCPEQLVPAICDLFRSKGLVFTPKGRKQNNNNNSGLAYNMYETECGFNDLKKIAPLSYLYYRDGDYRYYPTNCLIKYNKAWVNRRLRMRFSTVRIDNDGNVVLTH